MPKKASIEGFDQGVYRYIGGEVILFLFLRIPSGYSSVLEFKEPDS